MVEITKCPPGNALGVGDLQKWGGRRNAGRSGMLNNRERGMRNVSFRCKSCRKLTAITVEKARAKTIKFKCRHCGGEPGRFLS